MKFSKQALPSLVLLVGVKAQQSAYGQCGGIGWTGATTCVSGYACIESNSYYSQCVPGTATTSGAASATTGVSSATGTTKYAGVNIAGFDFGCTTDGSCNLTDVYPPLASLGGPDGASQMSHFVNNDKLNIFRLPVAWQYLVNNVLGGTLDSTNLAKYDQLVQACLSTGASCIIDIHNYARWNGAIIGQGGPTNAQFASLWQQLATKYASTSNVIFSLMNEPHDIPSITEWATSVQAAVTAIRNAGAKTQIILLAGNDYTSAGTFVSGGSAAALATVTNPDGTTTNLVFDVHKYLDSDNSGTHAECVTNNISDAFEPLATWLRSNNRTALNTETGGGNVASCETYLCQQIAYLNENSDVFLGFLGWSAGAFDSTYILTETPTGSTDTALVSACIAR